MHDGADAEEERGLEEGVSEGVVRGALRRQEPESGEHEAQLRDGGVTHDSLDVEDRHLDGRGPEGRDRAAPGDEGQGHLGFVRREKWVHAGDEVDACRHHRRGVDQGGDGRGAFHRVGEPDVEEDLGRLAEGADREEEGDDLDDPGAGDGVAAGVDALLDHLEEGSQFERPEGDEDGHDAEDEAEVADAVDDEGLLRGGDGLLALVEVADQQVRAEAHALPAEEGQEEVVAHDQACHREDEEVEGGEEAAVAKAHVVAHVLRGVEGDDRCEPGDEEHPEERERVDVEGEVGDERLAGLALWAPGEVDPLEAVGDLGDAVEAEVDAEDRTEADGKGTNADPGGELGLVAHGGEKAADDGGQNRDDGDEENGGGAGDGAGDDVGCVTGRVRVITGQPKGGSKQARDRGFSPVRHSQSSEVNTLRG